MPDSAARLAVAAGRSARLVGLAVLAGPVGLFVPFDLSVPSDLLVLFGLFVPSGPWGLPFARRIWIYLFPLRRPPYLLSPYLFRSCRFPWLFLAFIFSGLLAFILAVFTGILAVFFSACGLFSAVLDVLGQSAGFLGEFSLLVGEAFGVVAAVGAALDVLLLLDDPVEFLEIFADAFFFFFQAFRAVLAHQQFEQRAQVQIDRVLVLDGMGKLILAQYIHELLEPDGDQFVLALGDRLSQQGGAAGIGRGGEFGHPQQHVFEMFVLLGDAPLLEGELFSGSGLFLRLRTHGVLPIGRGFVRGRLRTERRKEAEEHRQSRPRRESITSKHRLLL